MAKAGQPALGLRSQKGDPRWTWRKLILAVFKTLTWSRTPQTDLLIAILTAAAVITSQHVSRFRALGSVQPFDQIAQN
jgi:hypothetical protein